MNPPDLVCAFCRRKQPYYRFWCDGCRGPLTQTDRSGPPDTSARQAHERKQLYQRILGDLDQLVQEREVAEEKSDAIREFYQTQLTAIGQREAERAETLAIDNLIWKARSAAHDGRFEQAAKILESGAQQFPEAFPVQLMLTELSARDAHEQAARAEREANSLLSQAKRFLQEGKLEQAQPLLCRASELDPENQGVREAFAAVEAAIAAEHAQPAVAPTALGDQDSDEIVMATLVETDETPDTELDKDLMDAAAMRPAVESQPVAAPSSPTTPSSLGPALARSPAVSAPTSTRRSFAETQEEVPNPTHRLIDAASQWSTVLKPFLVDNVGWFVGAFLVIAGFVVLIVSFWGSIEQNRILMHSLVYVSLAVATGMFFSMAYFMRLKYPQLENSSNVLLVIVALLIPLVFAAAVLTTLVPGIPADVIIEARMR